MYFPTSAARQLSTVPHLPHLPPEPIVALIPSPGRSLFSTLTKSGLSVWRVRPSALLSYLSRTPISLVEHGENVSVRWSPDGRRILIKTSESYLILIHIQYDEKPLKTPYQCPTLPTSTKRHFQSGPGEALPFYSVSLTFEGVIHINGELLSVSPRADCIVFSTSSPCAVQKIPWPSVDDGDESDLSSRQTLSGHETWIVNEQEMPWLVNSDVTINDISYSRQTGVETWVTSDGRAYFVQLQEVSEMIDLSPKNGDSETNQVTSSDSGSSISGPSSLHWQGICIHDVELPKWMQKQKVHESAGQSQHVEMSAIEPRKAVCVAINAKFSLIATGMHSGEIELTNFPSFDGDASKPEALVFPETYNGRISGSVCTMEWSSDGYVLAVGWQHGWAIWSVGGRCLAWGFGVNDEIDHDRFQDGFMSGVNDLFWGVGNFELFALSRTSLKPDGQLYVLPFAKSAFAEQQTPDNTAYAFLQMDDRLLIYRGADQPDMSVINPESDVWQQVKIPLEYLAENWPIRYSAISTDGRLIAVAGRRGLAHYSTTSGRWKLFEDKTQEQACTVRGGLLWFHHVLVAAVEVAKSYQIRLYSRDLQLSNQNILHREIVNSPIITLSLVDNSLLVFCSDNTLLHYLIVPTSDAISLHLCGSISFEGIIHAPVTVRGLSWMIPNTQKQLGDPAEDLSVATILMIVGGRLILLRPRKSEQQEVNYDMQILAIRIEFCWIHLRGIGALENSLWGYDGKGIRVWLNALNIESSNDSDDTYSSVQESVNIPLDFYPLSCLMDKGIIIGVEHETAVRYNLSFVLFRQMTSSHLFVHHVLLTHLQENDVRLAVTFASQYERLVYFSHSLEVLLHTVVESESDIDSIHNTTSSEEVPIFGVLPAVIEFLDYFDCALDVVIGCARKTEMTRWKRLFGIVGSPQLLFEKCLKSNHLKTAASCLLILHNLEQIDEKHDGAVRLLRKALEVEDWQLCKDVLRFVRSVDDTAMVLRGVATATNLFP